jgi:acetyl-CoA carboxylase biotin carboxyl carrier protein
VAGRNGRAEGDALVEGVAEVAGGSMNESSAGAGDAMPELDYVRGLIAAVDESRIDSLEIDRAGTRIRISKSPPPAVLPYPPAVMAGNAPAAMMAGNSPAALPAAESAAATGSAGRGAAAHGLAEVHSPMVGTFYRAPSPEAPPYVEVGTRVSKGQTLCILEAMKLMNELESEIDGVVREILVENAEPVEYGQLLFRIEPA